MYNIKLLKDRENLLKDASKLGDECPVDGICDSIPNILLYIESLEQTILVNKNEIQKLKSDMYFYKNKLNNVKSQKFRKIMKKSFTNKNK